MYIERAIEKELSDRFFTSKAVAVTGARQVGKTTVTRHLFPEIRRINMKDSRLSNAAKEDVLISVINIARDSEQE